MSTVTLEIDGRRLQAEAGSYVLAAAREAGIEIPTLCHHPDLEPVGACRLCMVEVTHPDWGGWSGLMTACLYPVAEGIQVSTRSERVVRARRGILALLAARCPGSELIQRLARRHGVPAGDSALHSDPAADSCILCGLCTRVCETYATGAIATVNRGSTKQIAPFDARPPDECVGCGACALVCPTGNLVGERAARSFSIWERTFETALCLVDAARCIGCGSCEEACPFEVPRVALTVEGQMVARIPEAHCRGCGACVGACPTGAITQQGFAWEQLLRRAEEGAER